MTTAFIAAAALDGCATSSPAPLAPGGAKYVYVIQDVAGPIIQGFSTSANGLSTPSTSLELPSGMYPFSAATDNAGQIYVGGVLSVLPSGQYAVMVFAAGASGTATPLRTILLGGSSPEPDQLTVDATGDIYVAGDGLLAGSSAIAVFPAAANGLTLPTRLIEGAATAIGYASGLAVDASGSLYAAYYGETPGVAVFSSTATGNVAPTRIITGVDGIGGVAVDASGNIYCLKGGGLAEFSSGATTSASPIRTIVGTATGIKGVSGIAVDTVGNLFVSNLTPEPTGTEAPSVLGFGPNASGNSAPVTNFTSPEWYDYVGGLAVH